MKQQMLLALKSLFQLKILRKPRIPLYGPCEFVSLYLSIIGSSILIEMEPQLYQILIEMETQLYQILIEMEPQVVRRIVLATTVGGMGIDK